MNDTETRTVEGLRELVLRSMPTFHGRGCDEVSRTCQCGLAVSCEALDALCRRASLSAAEKPRVKASSERSIGTAPTRDPLVDLELGGWIQRVHDTLFYARVICRSHGYALTVHGSLRRDLDVVAVPWTDEACDPQELAQALRDDLIRYGVALNWDSLQGVPEVKPLGRLGYSIVLQGTPISYLDLSIAPRASALEIITEPALDDPQGEET